MSEKSGPASKPVHTVMSCPAQKEIDKGKSKSFHCGEYDHRWYCCDCQFDHEHDHGAEGHFDVGDYDFGVWF